LDSCVYVIVDSASALELNPEILNLNHGALRIMANRLSELMTYLEKLL